MTEILVTKDRENEFEKLHDSIREIFWDIVFECTLRLKENIDFIDKTDSFIIYALDHDQSAEEKKRSMLKSVDKDLLERLIHKYD